MQYTGLIVGLGNPGRRYSNTRHNFGAAVVSTLLKQGEDRGEVSRIEKKRAYELFALRFDINAMWLVVLPLSYMNRSGDPVAHLSRKFEISPGQMLVAHDELDLAFGKMRFKFDSGLAGHNGLRSIANRLGSKEFYRLRLGIDRPERREYPPTDFVLSTFLPEEKKILPEIYTVAAEGVRLFCSQGMDRAMQRIHCLDYHSFA